MSRSDKPVERASRRSRSTAHPNLLQESNRTSAPSCNRNMSSQIKTESRGLKRILDENNENEEDEEGPVMSSLRGRDRHKNGLGSQDEEEEGDDGPAVSKGSINGINRISLSEGPPKQHIRSENGFTPGSIVRVKLINFITYAAVEFRPGPYLNMVIGPNGTGKSSIVCALALGLGWKPALLGRAKDVASFVKHGTNEATIEIELQSMRGQDNIVIERKIFSKDNRSEWRLNGQKSKAQDIQARIDEFNINVGNLCCFLPQDKVADFARMSPAELLKETQKAAGVEGMTRQHERLIELGVIQRELGQKIEKEKTELDHLQERNTILERDVRRIEERQEIVDLIKVLNLRIPFARYSIMKEKYDIARAYRSQCKKNLEAMKKTLEPLGERQSEMEERSREMDRDIKDRHKTIGKDTLTFQNLHNTLEDQEKQSQIIADKLSSVRRRELESKKYIANLIRQIKELEQEVRQEPERVNNQEYDAKLRIIKDHYRAIKDENEQIEYDSNEISKEVKALDREVDGTRKALNDIDSVKNQRLDMLRNTDPDVVTAVRFLRENAGIFRKRVYEPVLLEIHLDDPKFASAVEICVNYATLKTFICQTREDYDNFTRILVDEKKLRLNVVELEGNKEFPRDYSKPVSDQEARNLGFDRFIIDCIKGPSVVLQYLCESQNLHCIPYAENVNEVNIEAIEDSTLFKRYIVDKHMSTITYSTYGNRLPQTLTRNLRPARALINSIDHGRKRALESRMQEIGVKKRELESSMQELQKKQTLNIKRMDHLRDQQKQVEGEKSEAGLAWNTWNKKIIKLNTIKVDLDREKAKPSADEQMRKHSTDWAKINGQSRDVVIKIMSLMQRQVEMRSEADEASLRALQYQEKLHTLTVLKKEQESHFEEANAILEQATREFADAREKAMELHNLNKELVDDAPREVTDKFQQSIEESPDWTLSEMESRLSEEESKLGFIIEVRSGVREEYSSRQAKIADLTKTMQKMMKKKQEVDTRIKDLDAQWVASLSTLIDHVNVKFSRAFSAVSSAGEVRIAKHEDYNQWGIEILVKFRDGEPLQVLTANRQSGGERSISTITYLLSLTEMSRSPFSLVDEINQGMDQKYERQVHNHMVNVTCREEAGQYFLITPKLLPNLVYHERMKVLVVNNGEWIPEDGFNFGKYIRQKRPPPN